MKVFFLLSIISLYSLNSYSQNASSIIKKIKDYKTSIDSSHYVYDSLRKVVTTEADSLLSVYKLKEGIADGKGFELYNFFKSDTLVLIRYLSPKDHFYIQEYYYYRNNELIYLVIYVENRIKINRSLSKYEEYYSNKKVIAAYYNNKKAISKINSKSLTKKLEGKYITESFYERGMRLQELFGEKN